MRVLRAFLRRRRLLDAERRFFDAYGRGGERQGHELVVVSDFFVREDVRAVLQRWAAGEGALDVGALEQAWRHALATPEDLAHLRENLAHFARLLEEDAPPASTPAAALTERAA